MSSSHFYPIGTPGVAWGASERAQWLARQTRLRSYADDVERVLDSLTGRFERIAYGELQYGNERYTQWAMKSPAWDASLPSVLVTGGVHGYETSGVHGALAFLQQRAADYAGKVNLLVVPCVSPWGYERIHRWNAEAVDPNRSFLQPSPAREAAALMQLLASMPAANFLVHIDLHETTDTDESEYRPALAARDGKAFQPGTIPDGFYLVDDTENLQPAFQQAVLQAVAAVTHIAPAAERQQIIGAPVLAPGIIAYPLQALGLCASVTGARYTTTTEVYPDSPRTTPEICNDAQVVAVCAAIDYALR